MCTTSLYTMCMDLFPLSLSNEFSLNFSCNVLFKAITKLQFSFGSLGWMCFFFVFSHSVKCFVEQEANFNGPFSSFCLYRFLCYLLDFISNTQHKPFKSHLIYLTIHGQWKSRRQIKKQAASLDHCTVDTEYIHWMIIENFLNRFSSSNSTIENYFTHKISIKIDTY